MVVKSEETPKSAVKEKPGSNSNNSAGFVESQRRVGWLARLRDKMWQDYVDKYGFNPSAKDAREGNWDKIAKRRAEIERVYAQHGRTIDWDKPVAPKAFGETVGHYSPGTLDDIADYFKYEVGKNNGDFSETVKIKNDGTLNVVENGHIKLIGLYATRAEEMYDLAKKLQERNPQLKFNFELDENGQWIKYSVSLGKNEVGTGGRWANLEKKWPGLESVVGDLEAGLQECEESGIARTPWFEGVRSIKQKVDKGLASLEDQSGEDNQGKMNKIIMEAIDDLDLALPSIDSPKWRDKFVAAQGQLVAYLDSLGILRFRPKPGDVFDPKWQMGISGQGERVVHVRRGAFVDKRTGKILQEAWVEVA